MYLEVKEITITKEMLEKEKNITDKYPESGLYLATHEGIGVSDLVFVDKVKNSHVFICPKQGLDNVEFIEQLSVESITDPDKEFLNGIIDGFLDGTYINSKLIEKLK